MVTTVNYAYHWVSSKNPTAIERAPRSAIVFYCSIRHSERRYQGTSPTVLQRAGPMASRMEPSKMATRSWSQRQDAKFKPTRGAGFDSVTDSSGGGIPHHSHLMVFFICRMFKNDQGGK